MLATMALGSRPIATGARFPRAFRIAAVQGEYGWASWSYSRQAKLNAWSWHGIGPLGGVHAWATLGNALYMRGESDTSMYVMQPDTFMNPGETNAESTSVVAVTQWLDFAKVGKMKALTGIDMDCVNVVAVEVYVSENGGRTGTLAATIPISDNAGGWTYNGEVIPLEEVGSATEFMLRFVGDSDKEVQINRVTLHWDDVAG